jgi:hypothetical protein
MCDECFGLVNPKPWLNPYIRKQLSLGNQYIDPSFVWWRVLIISKDQGLDYTISKFLNLDRNFEIPKYFKIKIAFDNLLSIDSTLHELQHICIAFHASLQDFLYNQGMLH